MCVMSFKTGVEMTGRLPVEALRWTPGLPRFESLRTSPPMRVDGVRPTREGPHDGGRPSFGEFMFMSRI